jgi:hypothetical protein
MSKETGLSFILAGLVLIAIGFGVELWGGELETSLAFGLVGLSLIAISPAIQIFASKHNGTP